MHSSIFSVRLLISSRCLFLSFSIIDSMQCSSFRNYYTFSSRLLILFTLISIYVFSRSISSSKSSLLMANFFVNSTNYLFGITTIYSSYFCPSASRIFWGLNETMQFYFSFPFGFKISLMEDEDRAFLLDLFRAFLLLFKALDEERGFIMF